jgi:glyoxylase-like metal-dependent hydrolase (beta-lactamase superfamily II)
LYGDLVPIPASRVRVVQDGERLSLADRELELIHTPGHAMHHYALVDRANASIFPGDTFGISYRELDTSQGAFIVPTTTPTQFDPQQLSASIDRMMAYAPDSMYLMHFSRVRDLPRLAASLKSQIRELVDITQRAADADDPYAAIRNDMLKLWLGLIRQHGCTLADAEIERLLLSDLDLNTQGLIVWAERRRKTTGGGA